MISHFSIVMLIDYNIPIVYRPTFLENKCKSERRKIKSRRATPLPDPSSSRRQTQERGASVPEWHYIGRVRSNFSKNISRTFNICVSKL